MGTLRETIRSTIGKHLDAGYSVMGQCLTAVGWVGNTLPERYDMIELPCCDVAGAGFAVGHALAGKRPIFVIRYQGFSWFNAAMIVNYAAKSQALWRRPCPMLIRGIAMEGAIGPVAGSSHHALWNMPGVRIYSPMTPYEWSEAYHEFMCSNDVVYLSEHRGSWGEDRSYYREQCYPPEAVLFPISHTRAACDITGTVVCPLWKLRPLVVPTYGLEALRDCKRGIVIDDAHTPFAKSIAHDLARMTGARMEVCGLADETAGFYRDNLPPTKEDIIRCMKTLT